ncbi:MAG: DUF502 domain-containing protein [Bacteroidales bacterium]
MARPFKALFSRLVQRVPILKVITSAFSDLLSAFVGKERKFNRPVMVRVNKDLDLEKLGFLTEEDLSLIGETNKVAVYFPHSYNWSGELFLVPREQVRPIDVPGGSHEVHCFGRSGRLGLIIPKSNVSKSSGMGSFVFFAAFLVFILGILLFDLLVVGRNSPGYPFGRLPSGPVCGSRSPCSSLFFCSLPGNGCTESGRWKTSSRFCTITMPTWGVPGIPGGRHPVAAQKPGA